MSICQLRLNFQKNWRRTDHIGYKNQKTDKTNFCYLIRRTDRLFVLGFKIKRQIYLSQRQQVEGVRRVWPGVRRRRFCSGRQQRGVGGSTRECESDHLRGDEGGEMREGRRVEDERGEMKIEKLKNRPPTLIYLLFYILIFK